MQAEILFPVSFWRAFDAILSNALIEEAGWTVGHDPFILRVAADAVCRWAALVEESGAASGVTRRYIEFTQSIMEGVK